MLRCLGRLSLALWIAVLVIGTVIRFTYVMEPTAGGEGCYFADLGRMSIDCAGFPGADAVAWFFSLAWYWSWGMWWILVDVPYTWPVVAPAILTLWLAFRYIASRRKAALGGAKDDTSGS